MDMATARTTSSMQTIQLMMIGRSTTTTQSTIRDRTLCTHRMSSIPRMPVTCR